MSALSRPIPVAVAAGAYLALYVVLAETLPAGLWGDRFSHVAYHVPAVAALILLFRAVRAPGLSQRRMWAALATGIALIYAGDAAWSVLDLLHVDPTPSPGEALYVVGGVLLVAGLATALRAHSWLRSTHAVLDASVLTAAIVSVGTGVLLLPQLAGGIDATMALALTYPVLSVLALGLALVLATAPGRTPALVLLAGGILSMTVGDALYAWLAAHDAYASGHAVEVLWLGCYWLTAVAAIAARRPRGTAPAPGRDLGVGPAITGAAVLVAYFFLAGQPGWLAVVGAVAVIALVARLLLTVRENRRIAEELAAALAEQERLAVTDPVTGCRNLAFLEEMLRLEAARPAARLAVIALSLDTGPRAFDERDRVVAEAAGRLRSRCRDGELLARSGTAEFTIVLPGAGAAVACEAAERLRAAIAAEPFTAGALGATAGVACLPADAAAGEDLLRAAEDARDRARSLGGNHVRAADDPDGLAALERLADEVDRRRDLPGHSRAVSEWAAAVAVPLALDARECAVAGRLHDIALIAVPDALLRVSDNHGRAALARHREPHGAVVPPVAAVVAVCDRWAILREGRRSAPAAPEEARAALLADSGTELAPDVVSAFLQLEARGAVGRRPARSRPAARRTLADEVLAAAASAPRRRAGDPPPVVGPVRRSRLRRPAVLVAAAVALLAAWAGGATWLQMDAERAENDAVSRVAADRHLHEIELLRWRLLTGDLAPADALRAGRASWTSLRAALADGATAGLLEELDALGVRLANELAAGGGREVVARADARIDPEIMAVDELVDAEVVRAKAQADAVRRRAWWLTAGSGAIALIGAGWLLAAFGRARRKSDRSHRAAARAAGEQAALQESQRRFRALVEHASDSVVVIDAGGAVTFVTEPIEHLLGHPAAALVGGGFEALVDPDDQPRLTALIGAARDVSGATGGSLALRHRDGRLVPTDLRVADRLGDPDVAGIVLTLRDVSEQRRLETQLRQSLLRDRRTGLASRARFEQWAHDALAVGGDVAAVLVDLDDFKTVNESLGHPAGDRCLAACADRLRDAVGEHGRLARLGGDEFGVLLEGVTELETAEALARDLVDAVSGAVRLDGADVPLTASAGVALAAPGDLPEDLLRCADTAAHVAKAGGAGHVAVYSPAMQRDAAHRLRLRAALGAAVMAEQLELAYQPLVDLLDDETSGFEALLRWRTPEGEPVSPADFIPIAEASGLIVPLGAWVLRRACADVAPRDGMSIAVNVSPVQLRAPDFVSTVADALSESGLPPDRLVLELTESAVMEDVDAARDRLGALQALGVKIAIDDFGTGFSSLASLAALPVDLLKLDRSFVAAMETSPPHAALVSGVVSLAERLGLPLVAEGVETADQLEALRALGCRFAQGYHLGRPGPLPGRVASRA